jgi:dolichol-phosphate mannosyltransferase
MKPIIVIPTYNERTNIQRLIPALFALHIPNLEVIVVDDNSPDETAQEVEKMREQFPIYCIRRLRKLGLGTAYIAGFKKALALGADILFEMDADFSHDPADIPHLISAIHSADMSIGSRRVAGGKIIGWGWRRHATSACAMWISRMLLNLKTHDVTAGFRCFRRHVLEAIELDTIKSNGYAFQEELLFRVEKKGFRVVEVPVTFTDRTVGNSKLSIIDIWEFFRVMVRLKKKNY